MTHEQTQALLMAYAMGELDEATRQGVAEHLACCGECRAQLFMVETLQADLEELDQESPLPQAFQAGWREAVKEEAEKMTEKTVENRKDRRGSWRGALAVAAAAVFLVGGTLLTRDRLTGPATTGESNAAPYLSRSMNNSADGGLGMIQGETSAYDSAAMPQEAAYGAADAQAPAGGQEQAAKVIQTVDITLRTTNFAGDYAALQTLCQGLGGWVEYAYQSGDTQEGELRRGSLTLRIPANRLAEAKEQLSQTGRLVSLSEGAQDVTASYYDTQARLQTQREKLARLEKLMAAAESVSDLVEIESAIADTQYQIDAYESQLKKTDRQVDYASVSVSLREEKAADAAQTAQLPLGQRLGAGLKASLEAMGAFFKDMAVFLAASAPWLMVLAGAAMLVWLLRKGLKRRK